MDRIAKLSPIKIDAPDTEPLTDEEYEKILKAATGKTRTLIKLMRWSGLATRDASTGERTDLHFDKEKDIYKIIRQRHFNVKGFGMGGAEFFNGPTGTLGLSPANRFLEDRFLIGKPPPVTIFVHSLSMKINRLTLEGSWFFAIC